MDAKYFISSGTLTVTLSGELDERSSHKIRAELDNLIATKHFTCFVLDFNNVSFMDSTGIGVLIGRYKKLKSMGLPFVVKNTQPQVDKVFNASGLNGIITKI